MMRSANPTLNKKTFASTFTVDSSQVMTLNGTVNKTAVLLLLVVLFATFTWTRTTTSIPLVIVGLIGGLIFALVTTFKPHVAPWTAPLYALFEGLFLGGVSAMFEASFPGIVMNAVTLTFGILFALLMAYKSGLIAATENFKLGVTAATGGIFLVYMVNMVLGFFGHQVPYLHGSGPIGIGVSLFIVIIAALNLVLDFDFIEEGAEKGAPKYMEWYGAFGLVVTLVWLYLEILHLLSKLQGRDR